MHISFLPLFPLFVWAAPFCGLNHLALMCFVLEKFIIFHQVFVYFALMSECYARIWLSWENSWSFKTIACLLSANISKCSCREVYKIILLYMPRYKTVCWIKRLKNTIITFNDPVVITEWFGHCISTRTVYWHVLHVQIDTRSKI